MSRKLIKDATVITIQDNDFKILNKGNIIIENDRIKSITPHDIDENFELVINARGKIAMPGFINSHTHAILATLFRGITDDYNRERNKGSAIYSLVVPMMNIAEEILSAEEKDALLELGILEMLKSGATTIVEQCIWDVEPYLDILERIKIRAYLSPTVRSNDFPESDGREYVYKERNNYLEELERNVELFHQYNGALNDRIKIRIGMHAPDTCSMELLKEGRKVADKLKAGINIHLCQSRVELDDIKAKYNKTPVEYLYDTGILGDDLIAAHSVFTTERDTKILAETGTNIGHCPLVFAKGGIHPPFYKYHEEDINITIGTDSYTMDYFSELRSAAFFAKLSTNAAHKVTARDVFKAGTINGARALKNKEIGILAVGKKADIALIDMDNPFMRPVWDPIANLIWSSNPMMVDTVLVDGELVVNKGRVKGVDEQMVIDKAQQAADRVFKASEEKGILNKL